MLSSIGGAGHFLVAKVVIAVIERVLFELIGCRVLPAGGGLMGAYRLVLARDGPFEALLSIAATRIVGHAATVRGPLQDASARQLKSNWRAIDR